MQEKDFDSKIREQYHSFTKTQRKIANYILNNKQTVLQSSITTLARKIGTNPSTITRFCQSMRYKGFNELKFFIKNDMFFSAKIPETKVEEEMVRKEGSLSHVIQEQLKYDIDALRDTMLLMDERHLKDAIDLIANAEKVYFYAEGGTGSAAQFGYHLFLQIGVTSNCFTDSSLMLMSTVHLTAKDVVIGMSYSGCTEHVLDVVKIARQHRVPVIAITGSPKSPLARLSDVLLSYSCNIGDDLQYLHVARICEVAIIGTLETEIIKKMISRQDRHLKDLKLAITSKRTK